MGLGAALAAVGTARGDQFDAPSDRNAVQFRFPAGDAAVDRAVEHFRQRKYEACLADLESAVKQRPGLVPARLMLAKLFLMDNQPVVGRDVLERAAVENPDHPDVYLTVARLALNDGRLTDASLALDKTLALCASAKITPELKRSLQLDAHTGRATVAERRKDWPAAESALSALVALDPQNGQARRRLATALFRAGKRGKSFDELQAAAKADPSLDPAGLAMARLCAEANDAKKAREWLDYAVKAAPDDARVHEGYAAWLLDQGRPDEAKARADAALKLAPDSVDIRTLCGQLAWALKDYAGAEAIFQALHAEAPASFAVSNAWALALAEQDDEAKRRKARQLAEMNARLNPNSAEAQSTLGWVAYRQGRIDDAERLLRSALATGAATSDSAYFLARVEADRGRPDEVKALLKLALDAPGRFTFRKEAGKWLDELSRDKPAQADGRAGRGAGAVRP
jgi:Tfp pilus assembly protein PilF